MQFSDFQTDLFASGFDFLNDSGTGLARAKRWINSAYKEVVGDQLWPFREADQSGAAPLTVSDLGVIASVTDTTQANRVLRHKDRRTLVDQYGDVTTTGAPRWFYVQGGTSVKTFPVGGTIAVHYWKVPADMTAGSDVPIVPTDYHEAILHGARRRAFIFEEDDVAQAQAAEQERLGILERMKQELLDYQAQDVPTIVDYGSSSDWGLWGGW